MPLEPPGNRGPRWMVTHDRIRLTGLLRKPLQMRGFLFGRASPVRHGIELSLSTFCPPAVMSPSGGSE